MSKAALDKLVEAWRAEHPQIGFTRVVVGDCAGGEGESLTEFANGWDREPPPTSSPSGTRASTSPARSWTSTELVSTVDTVLRSGASACIQSVTVAPRPPGP